MKARLSVPTIHAPDCSQPVFSYIFVIACLAAILIGAILATVMTDPSALASTAGQGGPPSLDQILWMAIGSNYPTMTGWSMVGSACVAVVTSKILGDTSRYYDHYGFRTQPKVAFGIAVGTFAAVAHLILTSAQTVELCSSAFDSYHTVYRFDLIANTTSDFVGGLFNLAAALYYTYQVFRLSGRKLWLCGWIMTLVITNLVLTFLIAIMSYNVPEPEFASLDRLRDFNMNRVPYYKAWGVTALIEDGSICFSILFYLFKTKDSILHREKTLYHKFKALVLETMLPPVICTFILVIALEKKTATIGDYRRAVKYLLPPLYYLSLLHSVVGRIHIREHLAATEDGTQHDHKDSIPLTGSSYGQMSTIHIDPKRGKEVVVIEDQPITPAQEEIPCKRTFGATESITHLDSSHQQRPPMSDRSSSLPRPSKRDIVKITNVEDVPSKRTFGVIDSMADLSTNSFPLEDTGPATPPIGRDSPAGSARPTARKERGREGGMEFPSWADPYYFGTLDGRSSGR